MFLGVNSFGSFSNGICKVTFSAELRQTNTTGDPTYIDIGYQLSLTDGTTQGCSVSVEEQGPGPLFGIGGPATIQLPPNRPNQPAATFTIANVVALTPAALATERAAIATPPVGETATITPCARVSPGFIPPCVPQSSFLAGTIFGGPAACRSFPVTRADITITRACVIAECPHLLD
jgi:hypothetical protein